MRVTYFILLSTLAAACGDIGRGGDGGMPLDGDGGRFAVPGVRLHAFLDGFPSRNIGPSICADMAASLQAITDLVNDRLL